MSRLRLPGDEAVTYRKRIYLYLPVKSWSWVKMLLGMGRTVVVQPQADRNPWRNRK